MNAAALTRTNLSDAILTDVNWLDAGLPAGYVPE